MRSLINAIKNVLKLVISFILIPFIKYKFLIDSKSLPLTADHYHVYYHIHCSYWVALKKFPDLINCPDYNDKIQWLKLFDNKEVLIQCVDKVLVRNYVESKLGEGYLPEIYQVCDGYNDISLETLPQSFVLKTNHDSGSVFLISDKEKNDWIAISKGVEASLKRKFGVWGGEWPYSYVKPKVFAEEYLGLGEGSAPADYKFHCVNGEVKWLQYICDREGTAKEAITDSSGAILNLHLSERLLPMTKFNPPGLFKRMVEIAEILSEEFKYVRIDLYLIDNQIFVGEMTFFPMYGTYKGSGIVELGEMMDFERDKYFPCVKV